MRLTKAGLRSRVNGILDFQFGARRLTSHAGLELVREYLKRTGFQQRLRESWSRRLPRSDYGAMALVLLIVGLLIAGGRRLWHLRYLERDPLLLRFAGLARMPTAKTVGAWLRSFGRTQVEALRKLNAEITAEAIERLGVRRLTVDIDGSVVSTGLKVEGARRGFNPHHRKVPSYDPITAYEARLRRETQTVDAHARVSDQTFEHLESRATDPPLCSAPTAPNPVIGCSSSPAPNPLTRAWPLTRGLAAIASLVECRTL